jgi:hypothetical protein
VSGLERILQREAFQPEKYEAMEKLKVGIIGISAGAGTGFLTGCLARYLANTGKHSPAVVELGKGSLFDSFGMDMRFAGRQYFSFYRALSENKKMRGMRNMDEGINWILKSDEERNIKLSFEQKLRLISHTVGDVILCDLSGEAEPEDELLMSMDQIIVLIDPLPSKMLEGYQVLCNLKFLETERGDMIYVINKMNRGVNRRQLLHFLKIKKPVFLPLVNPECIYTAEYNCKIPYTVSEVKHALQSPLGEIAATLLF